MNTTANPDTIQMAESAPTAEHAGHRKVSGLYLAAMVFAFIIFWPLGLALLLWAAWREPVSQWPIVNKLGRRGDSSSARSRYANMYSSARMRQRPSNSALSAYLDSEKQRIEQEKEKLHELVRAFEAFKESERQSEDKKDFEAFLHQRDADLKD